MRRWLAGILLVAVAAGVVGYVLWRRATALPDWYLEEAASPDAPRSAPLDAHPRSAAPPSAVGPAAVGVPGAGPPPAALGVAPGWSPPPPSPFPSAPPRSAAPPPAVPAPAPIEQLLSGDELAALLPSIVADSLGVPEARRAIAGARVRVADSRADVQVVVRADALPLDLLAPAERAGVERLLGAFPMFAGRPMFVGLEGGLRIRGGRVALDDDVRVRVGELSLSLPELLSRLGAPPQAEWPPVEARWAGRRVTDLELVGERARVRAE